MNLREGFYIGDWRVFPLEGRLVLRDEERRIQPKSMDVLLQLAEHAGSAVEREALLASVWGERAPSDEPLTRCIGELRRAFGDVHGERDYIQTIHKRGYKLLAPVFTLAEVEVSRANVASSGGSGLWSSGIMPRKHWMLLGGALVVALLAIKLMNFNRDMEQSRSYTGQSTLQHTVAVLPFQNLSGDAANDPITDGIHDDILTQISRISALQVISRSSTLGYRDSNKGIPTIAAELGADGIIEGSVQRVDNRIRINVQLIDAGSSTNLWANTFEREFTAVNLFAIQTEIATSVANELRTRMTPAEQRLISSVPTENLAALEAYFQGNFLMEKRSTESIAAAQEQFRHATELDPGLALAWVGLAQSYAVEIFISGAVDDVVFQKAETAIRRALELEDGLGEAHAILGRLLDLRGDLVAAELAFQRAIELSPNDVDANHLYAQFLDHIGRPAEAVPFMRRAKELDPRSPLEHVGYGGIMERLGRFDEARENFEQSVRLDADFAPGYRLNGHLAWRAENRLDEAAAKYMQALEIDPGRLFVTAALAWLYLDLGDIEMAEAWTAHTEALGPESFNAARARMLTDLVRGRDLAKFRYPGTVHLRATNAWPALASVIEEDLANGDIDDARERLAAAYPGLMADDEPTIDRITLHGAIDLAYFLMGTGENGAAETLLEKCLAVTESTPRLGWTGTVIADVRIHALRGDSRKALNAMRTAIDEGWRTLWWYYTSLDPVLASIRDEPEFQAMVNEIRADVAVQLARLKQTDNYRGPELPGAPQRSQSATQQQ